MNYLSLFSGIGGFDLGFDLAGHECVGQCEIDEHARNVLRRHWPKVRRIENVKEIDATTFDVRPDIICGGFPCQDLSVAGKRAGLAGGKSGLWYEYRRIVEAIKPEWVVVENVPGLFSSNKGRDFAVLLRGLGELGYVGIWKTLDSRYFGVAQRRRRVFLVANLGGRCPVEILFEPEGVRRNSSEGKKENAKVTTALTGRLGGGGADDNKAQGGFYVVAPLTSKMAKGTGGPSGDECQNLVVAPLTTKPWGDNESQESKLIVARESGQGYWMEDEVAGTLRAEGENRPSRPSNVVCVPILEAGKRCGTKGDKRDGLGIGKAGDPMFTLQSGAQHGVLAFRTNQTGAGGPIHSEDVTDTLALDHPPAVCFQQNTRDEVREIGGKIAGNFGVRRLTPKECERLQGFPDNWTRWATKPDGTVYEQSDSQRYKQLGNAVTVSVAAWLGERISIDERRSE